MARPLSLLTNIAIAISVSVASAQTRVYSPHDKAFFADPAAIEFVRPGLFITINSAKIASDGVITTVYSVADPKGLPLDTSGVATPGTVSLSFVVAVIPNNQTQYTAYTTRVATGAVIASTNQAGADSGGVTTP